MGILIVLSKTECLKVIAEGLLSKHIRSNPALMSVSGYLVLERSEERRGIFVSLDKLSASRLQCWQPDPGYQAVGQHSTLTLRDIR